MGKPGRVDARAPGASAGALPGGGTGGWRQVLARRGVAGVAGLVLAAGSAALLAWTLYLVWPELTAFPWQLSPAALGLAFVVYSADLGLAAVGWHLIYRTLAPGHSLARDTGLYVVSAAARRLPGGILGLAAGRAYLYARHGRPWEVTATAVGLEAAVISLSGGLLSLAYLGALAAPGVSAWMVGLLVVVVAGAGFVLRPRTLRTGLRYFLTRRRLAGTVELERIAGSAVASWVAAHVATWLVGGVLLYVVAGVAAPVDTGLLPAVVGSWVVDGAVSSLLYFVPSGLGVTELTLATLLTAPLGPAHAAVAAISMRLFVTAGEVVWMAALVGAGALGGGGWWRRGDG